MHVCKNKIQIDTKRTTCFEKQFVTFLSGRGIKVLTIYLLRDTTYIKRVINLAKLQVFL